MITHKLAALGLAAALLLTLAGCSNSGSTASGNPASGASSSAPGQSATTASGAGGGSTAGSGAGAGSGSAQLTGTRLQQLLVGGTQLPAGLVTDSSQNANSGAALETVAAKFDLATMSCSDLINAMGQSGYGETATASSSSTNSRQEILNQAIYQFAAPTTAQAFYTGLSGKLTHCGTFTITDGNGGSGSLTTTVETAPTGLGQAAFQVSMTGQQGGTKATSDLFGVLDGIDVYVVNPGGLGISGAPTDIDAAALVRQLMANVAKG